MQIYVDFGRLTWVHADLCMLVQIYTDTWWKYMEYQKEYECNFYCDLFVLVTYFSYKYCNRIKVFICDLKHEVQCLIMLIMNI